MRMITRVLAAGALSLPLTLGVAGIASADTGDTNGTSVQLAAHSQDERSNQDRGANLDLNLDIDGLSDNDDGQDNQDDGVLNNVL